MFPNLFNATTIPVLQETLNFAQARHSVLAGNVANLDTPGYRTRDLSVDKFQELLREAIDTKREATELESPGMLPGPTHDPLGQVKDSLNSILFHDDSNVSLEKQITELAKNQFMHNLAITLMTSQFRTLQAAVSERV